MKFIDISILIFKYFIIYFKFFIIFKIHHIILKYTLNYC